MRNKGAMAPIQKRCLRRQIVPHDVFVTPGVYFKVGVDASSRSADTSTSVVVPALKYGRSGYTGVVARMEFTAAGRDSGSYVPRQIALSMPF